MYCTNCGSKAPEKAVFCWKCGEKLHLSEGHFSPPRPQDSQPAETKHGNSARPQPTSFGQANSTSDKSGIGGWLRFLILSLLLFGPIVAILRQGGRTIILETHYPEFIEYGPWIDFKIWAWIIMAGELILLFYAAKMLLTNRSFFAIREAIVCLWAAGPIGYILINFVALPACMGEDFFYRAANELAAELIGGYIVNSTIWTLYLLKSKRVKATYASYYPQKIPKWAIVCTIFSTSIFFAGAYTSFF